MATELERLLVRIDATTEQLRREVAAADKSVAGFAGKVDKNTQRIMDSFKNVGRSALALGGVLGAQEVFDKFLDNTIEAEGSLAQLNARLKSTQGVAGLTSKELVRMSQELQKTTTFADETTQSAQALLLTFTKIGRDVFPAALESVLDLSVGMKQDLQTSAIQVGKALNDPVKGLGSLSRAGIQFSKEQRELVKSLVEMGRTAEAQRIILKELETQFGGSAEAAHNTLGGSLQSLKNSFGDLFEIDAGKLGGITSSINAINDNLDTLANVAVLAGAALAGKFAQSLVVTTQAYVANTIAARADAIAQLKVAEANLAGASAGLRMAAAQSLVTNVAVKNTAAFAAYTVAQNTYTVAAQRAAVGTNLLKSGIGLLGGPGGIILTAATAFYLFSDSMNQVEEVSEKYKSALEGLTGVKDKLAGKTTSLREQLQLEAGSHIDNAEATLKEVDAQVKLLEAKIAVARSGENTLSGIGRDRPDLEKDLKQRQNQVVELSAEIKKAREELNDFLMQGTGGSGSGAGGGGITGGGEAGKKLQEIISRQKEYAEQLRLTVEQTGMLAAANDDSADAYERVKMELDAENELREQGFKQGTAEYDLIKKLILQREQMNKKIKDTTDIRSKAEQAAQDEIQRMKDERKQLEEEFQEPFKNALENIQRSVSDTFEGIFDGSVNSAGDAAAAMKKIFFRLAAELATLAIFRPQVLAAGGLGGLLGSAVNGSTTSGFGVGDIFSAGSSLGNFGGSLSGTMLGGVIDSIGSSLGLSNAGFIGPMLPGQTAGLSGGFTGGAGLAGFAGNLGANLLFGERGIGASIGGAAGGIAGTAIGANMGTILGFAGGPAGALIGAFAGNLLGGLIGGGKPSSKEQVAAADFATGRIVDTGGLTGKKFSQENLDKATQLAQLMAQFAKAAGDFETPGQFGASAVVNNRTGIGFEFGPNVERQMFDSTEKLLEEFLETIEEKFPDKFSEGMKKALEKIDFTDADQALADINFVKGFDEMLHPLSEAERAVKALDAQFAALRAQASRLGLPLEGLNKLYDEQRQLLEQGELQKQLQSVNDTISGIQSGQLDALREQEREAQQLLQSFGRISDGLSGLLQDLTFGQFSALNPRQRVDAMRAQLESLGARSQLGDTAAAEELQKLVPGFLQLSGEVNGFNAQFAADRDRSEQLTRASLQVFTRQSTIQEQIAARALEQIRVMEAGFDKLAAALGAGKDVATGKASNAAGVSLTATSGAFGLSVGQVEAIGRSLTGYTGSTGAGQLQAAINAQGKQAQFEAALRKAAGMAEGGIVSGGIPGIDSVPKLLMPGEAVIRAQEVGRATASQQAALAAGRLPTNDNRGTEQRLDRIEAAVMQLTRITAQSGTINRDLLTGVQGELAQIRSKARLEAAR